MGTPMKKKANVPAAEELVGYTGELLAGYLDENGVLHKEFTVREMTGRDEEFLAGSDLRKNASKLISALVERCTLNIGTLTPGELGQVKWKQLVQNLYTGDQDIITLKIREVSVGREFNFSHACPQCAKELTTEITVDDLTIVPFKGERTIPFTLPRGYRDTKGNLHSTGTLRLTTGLDREILTPVAKQNVQKGLTLMLVRLCKFDDGYAITDDVMASLIIKDRNYLQNLLEENAFGVSSKIDVTCPQCGANYKTALAVSDFF